jgi:hypothetical protein
MILNKEDIDKVVGEIYIITNIITNISYIGQTRSHRLNHNKYRPFGYLGRFKDHIAESKSNKKHTSRYLNSALRKYGIENFTCKLLHTCRLDELNINERKFILEYKTKYPNGYNLTDGGQEFSRTKPLLLVSDTDNELIIRQPKNKVKSDYTKSLISSQIKVAKQDISVRKSMMKITQTQHYNDKFNRFGNVVIDNNNISQYIHIINNNKLNTQYVRIVIDKVKTTFVGKYETIEQIYERATQFITELLKWRCVQIAGNP